MEKQIAVKILTDYFKKKTYLNIALNKELNHASLNRQGKNRVTVMVYGTIQNLLFLEYQLYDFIQGKHVKVYERSLLLVSLYEYYYMHVPEYAIADESVKIAKKKGQRTAGFINAVLRHAFKSQKPLPDDDIEKISVETSHPLWMVKMFVKQYGLEETRRICLANLQIPNRTARINTLKITKEQFLKDYSDFKEGLLSEDAVIYNQGNIAHTEAFKKGFITIQDESSQLPTKFLNPRENSTVLDMCGAPGSKTAHLAALMNNTGHIDVYDLYEHKIELIKENITRLGVTNTTIHCGDSTLLNEQINKKYDYILLDGPCSGLGVLARKPEIKYHDSRVMDEIIPLQLKLLENAYVLCKNSGSIVYSTCTINKKENEKQIESFLLKHPDMKKKKELTILPYMYHSDGFYVCLLEKE